MIGEPPAIVPGVEKQQARADASLPAAMTICVPPFQTTPVVFNSPHSGRYYPPAFLAQARLGKELLRRAEDAFVDHLFAAAPRHGAPLIAARYARTFIDLNRDAFELDAAMFAEPLPAYVKTDSLRVADGLGTLARVVGNGVEIYRAKLPFAEALHRIERIYRPYHAAVQRWLAETRRRFGVAVLIDCHSMPSSRGRGAGAADIVLGDRHGQSCDPALIDVAEQTLAAAGYRVVRNRPYAGGFFTARYGTPAAGFHALQIEIARDLYMDEAHLVPHAHMAALKSDLEKWMAALVRFVDQKWTGPGLGGQKKGHPGDARAAQV